MANTRNLITIQDLSSLDFSCDVNGLRIALQLIDNGDGLVTLADSAGTTISTVAKADLTDNGNGTYTFTNNDGSDVVIDTNSVQSSATQAAGNTDADVTSGDARTIATHNDGDGNLVNINESVTLIEENTPGVFTYTAEDGTVYTIDICASLANCGITQLGDVDTTGVTANQVLSWNGANWVPADPAQFGEYQAAFDPTSGSFPSTSTRGDWFNATTSGTVDGQAFEPGDILVALVDNPSTTTFAGNWTIIPHPGEITSSVTNVIAGNRIATHDDGNGNLVDIDETITTISYNDTTKVITYTPENGTPINLDVSDLDNTSSVTSSNSGKVIASHDAGDGSPVVNIEETVTTLSAVLDTSNPADPILQVTYVNEDGTNAVQNVSLAFLLDDTDTTYDLAASPIAGNIRLTGSDGSTDDVDICAIVAATCAPDGSETIVNAGTNVTVTGTGTAADPYIVSTADAPDPSVVTQAAGNADADVVAGDAHTIATHDDGTGSTTTINETVTSLSYNVVGQDGTLTYTKEDGTTDVINLIAENFLSSSSFNNTTNILTLTMVDGSSYDIDLTDLIDIYALGVSNSNCISLSLTGDGSAASPWDITATPVISGGANNLLSCEADGLFVDASIGQLTNVDVSADTPTNDCDLLAWDATAMAWKPMNMSQSLNCAGLTP